MVSKSSLSNHDYLKLPEVTFEETHSSKFADIIVIIQTPEDIPANLKHYLERERISSDLKSKKQVTIYADKSDELFERATIYTWGTAELTELEFSTKITALGCKIFKEVKATNGKSLTLVIGEKLPTEFRNHLGALLGAVVLASYEFDRRFENVSKSVLDNPIAVEKITVIGTSSIFADDHTNFEFRSSLYSLFARETAAERPDVATTLWLRDVAHNIANAHKDKVTLKEIVGDELEKQGLNLLHAVGKASSCPPLLVSLHYQGTPHDGPVIALVGKGIVFDSGGLSIKTTSGMDSMYCDKAGACHMLAVFRGAVELGLPINLVCTIAVAENFIGPKSYRNSDIIRSLKGLTVEIKNTDAEGRLVLADAFTWTQQNYKVKRLIDIATLTGACSAALGSKMGGLFTNDEEFGDEILKLSKKVEEPFWHLPITEDNFENMKGVHSDLRNANLGAQMGASNAAAFLHSFIEKGVKWVHLDIAGPGYITSPYSVYSKGTTGFGVKVLLHYLRLQALKAV